MPKKMASRKSSSSKSSVIKRNKAVLKARKAVREGKVAEAKKYAKVYKNKK